MGDSKYSLADLDGAIMAWQNAARIQPASQSQMDERIAEARRILAHGPLPPAVMTPSQASVEYKADMTQAWALLKAKKWDELDKTAAQLRATKTEYPSGRWQLTAFYESLRAEPNDKGDETLWKKRHALLEEWRKMRPNSFTAKAALALSWLDGAWIARGDGYADTITPEGEKQMESRGAKAHAVLEAAKADFPKCPLFYVATQRLSLLEGWENEASDQLFREGVKHFPTYWELYLQQAVYLMPRWYGEPGQWEKFAAQSCDQIGGVAGEKLYARICWGQYKYGYKKGFWKETKADWKRAKSGYLALLNQFPNSLSVANTFAHQAAFLEDNATATSLFVNVIQGKADPAVWTSINSFNNARLWVLSRP